MKVVDSIPLIVLGIIALGMSFEEVNADVVGNQAYLVEGSGFAVTPQSIKISQIDLLMSTANQIGTRAPITIEDGFVTLDEEDFVVTDLTGTVLRDGRFIRLLGIAGDSTGNDVSISIFGRLIQNSDEGSIYSFTGRLTKGDESNKIIYTTKISGVTSSTSSTSPETPTTSTEQKQEKEIVIHIRKGASDPSQFSYIDLGQPTIRGFYSQDRIIIDPGDTVTWVNDDDVSHSISSGTGLGSSTRASQGNIVICDESQLENIEFDSGVSYSGSNCTFTMDGRIKSGEILPGESWSVTIEEPGFYRLADVDYIWMTSTIYAFPSTDSKILSIKDSQPLN